MKVRDESTWQARRAALTEDGEVGQAFLGFLEAWAQAAEQYVAITEPAGALDDTLAHIESERGTVGITFLGQMLAVLAEHWEYGPDMMKTLTPIERRLVEEMTLIKVAHEQEKAEETHDDGVPDTPGG